MNQILVVDDDPRGHRVLEGMLRADGYEVREVPDALTAMAAMAAATFALVVVDVMPPGMRGLEVCEQIHTLHPLVPILAVTAHPAPTWRARAMAAGADGFLSDADELLPWVRQRLLRQARERARDAERRMHAADANAARWQVVAALAVAVAPCRDFDGFLAKVIDILAAPLGLTTAALYERDRGHFVLAAPAGGPAMPGHGPRFASFPVQISGSRDGMLTLGRVAAFTVADRTLIEQLRAPLTGAVARLRADATGPLLAASRLRCAHLLVHDFKNLIGAVSANLELLAHGDRLHLTPAGRSEATRGAAAATDRLRQLTLDLLDIASAEDEALAIAPHATDLSALALEAIAHWRGVIVTRRVRLALDLPEDLVAEVDARLVIRVFWNLLDNALRCVPEGGRIEFGARREADQLVFRVGHEDRAIPPAQRDRLFEPYWRSPEVVDPQHHGLGLYFCKVVVEAHGGTIEARDRPGGGTEFEFTLRSPRA